MSKHREPAPAVYLAAVLNGETPPGGVTMSAYRCAMDAESLVRLGRRAAKIALDRCNGVSRYDLKVGRYVVSWTEADEARAEKAVEKIEKEAAAILGSYGASDISASGDPRGFCLKFRLASGRSNSFGGEVWGV